MILGILISAAFAQNISGYEIPANKITRELKGPIVQIVNSKNDYFIQVGEYAALYRFPNTQDKKKKTLKQLQRWEKKKEKITLTVDPLTAKIISIKGTGSL